MEEMVYISDTVLRRIWGTPSLNTNYLVGLQREMPFGMILDICHALGCQSAVLGRVVGVAGLEAEVGGADEHLGALRRMDAVENHFHLVGPTNDNGQRMVNETGLGR